jgi:hypothetical protein
LIDITLAISLQRDCFWCKDSGQKNFSDKS